MPMDETAMAALCKTYIMAVPGFPVEDGANFINDAVLVALCKGVIDHIKMAMTVTSVGPDPQGGTQTVTSTVVT